MKKSVAGFTLIELLVVVTIIGILAVIVTADFGKSRQVSRDIERQSDLRNLQAALELYRNAEGRYPAGCNGPNNWSGQKGSASPCASGSQYVVGLAPKYIPVLPTDPKLNGASGYMYTVDADGMVYKIMAENTVESEVVTPSHQFSRCGDIYDTSKECASVPTSHTGTPYTYNVGGITPSQCNTSSTYSNDYAMSGGYANGGFVGSSYFKTEKAREYFTDIIRCK